MSAERVPGPRRAKSEAERVDDIVADLQRKVAKARVRGEVVEGRHMTDDELRRADAIVADIQRKMHGRRVGRAASDSSRSEVGASDVVPSPTQESRPEPRPAAATSGAPSTAEPTIAARTSSRATLDADKLRQGRVLKKKKAKVPAAVTREPAPVESGSSHEAPASVPPASAPSTMEPLRTGRGQMIITPPRFITPKPVYAETTVLPAAAPVPAEAGTGVDIGIEVSGARDTKDGDSSSVLTAPEPASRADAGVIAGEPLGTGAVDRAAGPGTLGDTDYNFPGRPLRNLLRRAPFRLRQLIRFGRRKILGDIGTSALPERLRSLRDAGGRGLGRIDRAGRRYLSIDPGTHPPGPGEISIDRDMMRRLGQRAGRQPRRLLEAYRERHRARLEQLAPLRNQLNSEIRPGERLVQSDVFHRHLSTEYKRETRLHRWFVFGSVQTAATNIAAGESVTDFLDRHRLGFGKKEIVTVVEIIRRAANAAAHELNSTEGSREPLLAPVSDAVVAPEMNVDVSSDVPVRVEGPYDRVLDARQSFPIEGGRSLGDRVRGWVQRNLNWSRRETESRNRPSTERVERSMATNALKRDTEDLRSLLNQMADEVLSAPDDQKEAFVADAIEQIQTLRRGLEDMSNEGGVGEDAGIQDRISVVDEVLNRLRSGRPRATE